MALAEGTVAQRPAAARRALANVVRRRPTSALVLINAVILAVIGVGLVDQTLDRQDALVESEAALLATHAKQTALAARAVLDRVHGEVTVAPGLLRAFDMGFSQLWAGRIESIPQVRSVNLVGPNGILVNDAVVQGRRAIDVSDRAYFQRHRAGDRGTVVTDPMFSRARQSWFFGISRGVFGPDGRFLGAAVLGIEPTYFILEHGKSQSLGVQSLLLTGGGIIAASTYADREEAATGAAFAPDQPPSRAVFTRDPTGTLALAAREPVVDTPLTVFVSKPVTAIVAEAWLEVAGLLLMALTGMVASILMVRRLKVSEHGLRRHAEALEAARASLTAQTETLAAKNEELDQFIYVASHDLKSPLRGLASVLEWIEDDVAAPEGGDLHAYLRLAQGRVTRLEGLLTGLLEYHRVGKDEMAVEEIDTGALVDAITADLELPQGFQVRRAETMPRITGPRTPLETVLRNLIANAAKHHDRDRGLVTVTGAVDGAWVRFRVTDDGPGIDPQYREHVFKLFTTLKPRDTVEGSGMGLAIVKRIVKRFGGAIRLTAPEDGARGTVAAFTWPAQAG